MRGNPVRTTVMKGGTAFGHMAFEFFTPGLFPILAAAGAEFVILDTEHSGVGIETIKSQVAYARGTGVVPLVRVPGTHYHLIAPMLDAGVMGIMVPMVETADQAARIASWCRYRPEGVRGLAFGMPHDDYTGGDHVAKMKAANERTLVIALIETATGIENVDAIMATPGVDVGWLGHFDLSNALGIDGQFDHPRFKAAVKKLVKACERNGKPAGFLCGDVKTGRRFLDQGFRMLAYGVDSGLFQQALKTGIDGLRAAKG
ncbi:MAG: aldolase [Alphaproteobacteria bacterium]|nr:aldolase [Alphaproteobacteria bacterium]